MRHGSGAQAGASLSSHTGPTSSTQSASINPLMNQSEQPSSGQTKTPAFECGIVKSELETDDYHLLCCLLGYLLALGKKISYLNGNDAREEREKGKRLIECIKRHIESQRVRVSTSGPPMSTPASPTLDHSWSLAKAGRLFGQYHHFYGNYEDAVRCLIHAMEHLRKVDHQKLDPEVRPLCQIRAELEKYCNIRSESLGYQPFIQPGEEEVEYLDNVIKAIPCPTGYNRPEEENPHSVWLQHVRDKVVVRQAITDSVSTDIDNLSRSLSSTSEAFSPIQRVPSRPVQSSDAREGDNIY
ncbi:uncharacterized protein [Watersipora subatra]|uniref:uncharacterized protein n=1 Tax=Watersipora subatra TaxID=2589382 RepID=UPI00355B4F67